MSDAQPKKPYVYQPDGINSPNYPRIFALGGPGVPEPLHGERFTRPVADCILEQISTVEQMDRVLHFAAGYISGDDRWRLTPQQDVLDWLYKQCAEEKK